MLLPPARSGSRPRRSPATRSPVPTSPWSLPPCSTIRVPGTRRSSWSAETARSPRPCGVFPDHRHMPSTILIDSRKRQHRADALRDAASDLALDDGGIDKCAAVLSGDIPLHLHDASLNIDFHDRAVSAAGPSAFAAVERGLDLELGVHVGTELP